MTPWTRRLIGPGRIRSAAPTQPLDDTPAAADTLGWLPSDELADAVTQDDPQHDWDHVIAYCVIGAVCLAIGLMTAVLMLA